MLRLQSPLAPSFRCSMKPLRTKNDLIALVAQHAPSNACARALSENRATVLGGFAPIEGLPSYVVHVRSYHGKDWFIAVLVDEPSLRHRIRYLEVVPWEMYIGKMNGKRPLIDGDKPNVSAFNRMRSKHGHTPAKADKDQ